MTQTQSLTTLALTGQPIDYTLELLNAVGQPYEPRRIFSARDPERVGILEGVSSVIDGGGACKLVEFSGRKDLIGGDYAQIVRFRINDGNGWKPAGFGVLKTGHSASLQYSQDSIVRPYQADTETLLRRSVVRTSDSFPPQDVGALARELVRRYRHPALGYDPDLIPDTGFSLDEPSSLRSGNLLDIFAKLANVVETAGGPLVSYGVDEEGRVFFHVPSGSYSITYEERTVTELPVDMADLCSAVDWNISNEPSRAGWTGTYKPKDLGWISIPDPALHAGLMAFKGLQPEVTTNLFVPRPASSYTAVGFDNPEQGSNSNPAGSPTLGTVASLTSVDTDFARYTITGAFDSSKNIYMAGGAPWIGNAKTPLPIFGCRVRYRMDTAQPGPIYLDMYYRAQQVANASGVQLQKNLRARYILPYSDGVYTTQDYILPPPDKVYYEDPLGVESGDYEPLYYNFYAAEITVGTVSVESFWISDFRFLCLNTTLLLNAARRELKTPAQNPATLQSVQDRDGIPRGRYVPSVPFIEHTAEGRYEVLPVAEIRHSFNAEVEYACAVDVGNPARLGEDALVERIAAGIERSRERIELRVGGRL